MSETKQARTGRLDGDQSFRSDVRRLGRHVEQLHDDLSGIAMDAGEAAHSGAAALERSGKSAVRFVGEKGGAAAATLRGRMASHPAATVGIAVGVGILIGLAGPAIVRARRRVS